MYLVFDQLLKDIERDIKEEQSKQDHYEEWFFPTDEIRYTGTQVIEQTRRTKKGTYNHSLELIGHRIKLLQEVARNV